MPLGEVISRRNLPHWFVPDAWHFVTYRLADTIPVGVLHQLREVRNNHWQQERNAGKATPALREQLHKQFFAAYDRYLDHSRDIDWLAKPKVAALIRGNLYHHNGGKYHLLAYCIMPNHVHILLRGLNAEAAQKPMDAPVVGDFSDENPDSKGALANIMHSLKSYTANEANKLLQRAGQFWQHESYDHWVRDEGELERIVAYIAWNPVKANLASKPHEWNFSSAHDRWLQDGEEEGFLLLE